MQVLSDGLQGATVELRGVVQGERGIGPGIARDGSRRFLVERAAGSSESNDRPTGTHHRLLQRARTPYIILA